MKKLVLAATFVAAGLLGQDASAHGGNYRGPGDTVPPGGGGGGGGGAGPAPGPSGPSTPGSTGPTTAGPGAPSSPAGGSSNAPTTPGGARNTGPDLTVWSFWWEFNKEPYLNLKSSIWSGDSESGSSGFFLGRGEKAEEKDSMRPSDAQIRDLVVPALKKALENETNNDIVTGAMIALAKIGDVQSESGESEFQQIIAGFLSDGVQEISETAAVSLGILANPKSIDLLASLMRDQPEGRNAVGAGEVPYRTRSFAAYGLGLIGSNPAASADDKAKIVEQLVLAIEGDDTKSRDLRVACLIALGLVPIENMGGPLPEDAEGPADAWSSRWAQMQYVQDLLNNEDDFNFLTRAHAPTALARLLDGMDAETYEYWRAEVVRELTTRASKRSKDQNEIIESAVLSMGLVGTNSMDEADVLIRDTLESVPSEISDQQSKNFSTIAMAKVGATGTNDYEKGLEQSAKFLLKHLDGKSNIRPWAGLAIGVMCDQAKKEGISHSSLSDLGAALRTQLAKERQPQNLAAYAIGAGIMQDLESSETLMKRLETTKDFEALGYVAVALGLMNERNAIEDIQQIIDESKYRPELLKQAAIALGLLGDKALVARLIEMLQTSKGLATQAAISSALGFIGDARSIDPLVEMLENKDLTDRARGFAAVALGIVADKQELPWNTKIAVDLNYRANTSTLVDPSGTGILDIL